LSSQFHVPQNSLLRQAKRITSGLDAGLIVPGADFGVGLLAAWKVGKVALVQLAADNADRVGSFDPERDAVAGNPIHNDRDVTTDDETFSNFAAQN
jgi:hypothetical protein